MSYTHGIRTTWTDGTATLGANFELTNEGQITHNVTLAAEVINAEVALAFTNALLRSIFILSPRDVIMRTNTTGGSPTTIKANVPFVWQLGGYFANPFIAADVTKFFFSNPNGAGITTAINIRVLVDATP